LDALLFLHRSPVKTVISVITEIKYTWAASVSSREESFRPVAAE
jgi:hypothetical protein